MNCIESKQDVTSIDNLVFGPDGTHVLPCYTDTNGDVFVYGIS